MSSTKIDQNRYMMSSGRDSSYDFLILLCDVLVTSYLIKKPKSNWIWHGKTL